jgi:hypothetical protein
MPDEAYYERLRRRLAGLPDPVCAVCQKPFRWLTGRQRSQIICSPRCSEVYAKCRYYFNPEAHDQMMRRHARYVLRRPEKHSPKTVAKAEAILAGTASVKRVVRRNSEVYLLLESVGRLDLLPES